MALDRDQVRRIAELARLELAPGEEAILVEQLGKIVDYFGQLQRFEAAAPAAESPADAAADAGHPEAEDEAAPGLAREAFLGNAPQSFAGFLVVPQVKGG